MCGRPMHREPRACEAERSPVAGLVFYDRPAVHGGFNGDHNGTDQPRSTGLNVCGVSRLLLRKASVMSRNYYSEIHLHLVWHTKNSSPLLVPRVETAACASLRRRCAEADVELHAIGGTPTHIHMAVTIPPTLTITTFVGQLKGGSAHDVNHAGGRRQPRLHWQVGYGVVSFGTKDMGWVCNYVENQPAHHAKKIIRTDRLERITDVEDEG
jgi:putative transposase